MPNMSYCRFENTVSDLSDCYDHMGDNNLSDVESQARSRLLSICIDIARDYGGLDKNAADILKEVLIYDNPMATYMNVMSALLTLGVTEENIREGIPLSSGTNNTE